MSGSLEDQMSRLRAMSMCSPVSGTDLDEDGIAAIAMAVRVLSVIQFMDIPHAEICMDTIGTKHFVKLESASETGRKVTPDIVARGYTWLECFSEAGRALE